MGTLALKDQGPAPRSLVYLSVPAQVSRHVEAKKLGMKSENKIEVMCVCERVSMCECVHV